MNWDPEARLEKLKNFFRAWRWSSFSGQGGKEDEQREREKFVLQFPGPPDILK
jgi:hypothetical protein